MNSAQATRLDTWKVIAAYLGRNVRTVTRWAEKRDLPVHRVPGGKRGTVFAYKDELDDWFLSQQRASCKSNKLDPQEPPPDSHLESPNGFAEHDSSAQHAQLPQTSLSIRIRPQRWLVTIAAGVLVIASIAIAITLKPASSHASQLFSVKYASDTLEARDVEGRTLWTYRYPQLFSSNYLTNMPGDYARTRIADFFHDGQKEVAALIALRSGPNPSEIVQTEIDFFSGSGKLLWRFLPENTFQFGSHELKSPWAVFDLLVAGSDRQTTLWVTGSHHTWGNAFVVQLDPHTGGDTLRFVNTGILYRLNELKTPAETFLLAGGFNNEWDSGSLAIVNENRPFAASPQTPGSRHYCGSCPPGVPDYYFVFPRSEINRVSGLYQDPVFDIQIAEDGIQITKYERFTQGGETTIYLLSPQPPFTLLSLRYNSDYDMLHRAWSAEGKLSHSLTDCPERLHPQPVRLWTASGGWTNLPVKPAKANQ